MLNAKGEKQTNGLIDYLHKQHKTDPLVVSVLLFLAVGIRSGVVDAEEGHFRALPLPVRRGDRVRAVYPAIRVQDVLGQVFAVYAVDGIADILASGDDQGERYQYDHGKTVMHAEDGAVDVNMRDLYKALQTAEYVQHLGTERCRTKGSGPRRKVTIPRDNVSLQRRSPPPRPPSTVFRPDTPFAQFAQSTTICTICSLTHFYARHESSKHR